jgi:hypothetical protein
MKSLLAKECVRLICEEDSMEKAMEKLWQHNFLTKEEKRYIYNSLILICEGMEG